MISIYSKKYESSLVSIPRNNSKLTLGKHKTINETIADVLEELGGVMFDVDVAVNALKWQLNFRRISFNHAQIAIVLITL